MRLELCLLAALLGAPALSGAADGPWLHCRLEQSNTVHVLDYGPAADIYRVPATNINDNFHFKAVVVAADGVAEYVKIYVYYQRRGQPILLQQATYRAPTADGRSLTGEQRLYSPILGRELQYDCALTSVRP
ncbi:hypothetical protein ACLIIZ_10215 [Azonexus caeni]|uniref:hypothetical protein n=1 Tax=Azonexus caeni TaxID=266126 RepID=UPI003A8BCAAA